MKQCIKCNEFYPHSEFYVNNMSADKLNCYCHSCDRDIRRFNQRRKRALRYMTRATLLLRLARGLLAKNAEEVR